MYSNHPDPYAGQYPPPPPLTDNAIPHHPDPSQAAYHITPPPMPQEQPYYPNLPQPVPHVSFEQERYTPPPLQDTHYSPPIQAMPEYSHQLAEPSYTPYNEEIKAETRNNQDSLKEYLRHEREEYMKHQPQNYNDQEKQTEEYQELLVDSEKPLSKKETNKLKKQQEQENRKRQEYVPYVAQPTLASYNEAETYRQDPYQRPSSRGCNCCCYNPAMTCCSCFWMLLSVAFLAGGIALIIASKVVSDRCNSECGDVIQQAQEACGTICKKVVHDAMLYSGIVVAGLAGIAIIWRLVMWTCAGYSRR
ncbi:hypothetical protein G6F62_007615 [Rhizopus arrhizus]|nr:hypothetical protein G6F62_007615 [Rhizopus arrhizus]